MISVEEYGSSLIRKHKHVRHFRDAFPCPLPVHAVSVCRSLNSVEIVAVDPLRVDIELAGRSANYSIDAEIIGVTRTRIR